jgi:hypothetical protein
MHYRSLNQPYNYHKIITTPTIIPTTQFPISLDEAELVLNPIPAAFLGFPPPLHST